MKKKLTMLLLALVIAFGGTSVAMLSGCGSCDDTMTRLRDKRKHSIPLSS